MARVRTDLSRMPQYAVTEINDATLKQLSALKVPAPLQECSFMFSHPKRTPVFIELTCSEGKVKDVCISQEYVSTPLLRRKAQRLAQLLSGSMGVLRTYEKYQGARHEVTINLSEPISVGTVVDTLSQFFGPDHLSQVRSVIPAHSTPDEWENLSFSITQMSLREVAPGKHRPSQGT